MKKISVLLISTLFIASCVKEELKQDALVESYKINATVEDFSSDTKAAVSDDGKFTWQANDQIRVIKNSESMVSSPLSVGGSKDAVFEFASSIDGYNMGFFPSDIEYNGKVTLPAGRVWQENNATPVMKASLENGVFNFKHLGGVVRVQIQNVPTAARKFVFHAKGYQINGTFTNGESLETNETKDTDAQKYTLTFDAPQQNTTMNFYVPLPVGDYAQGFKISLMNENSIEIYSKDGTTSQSVAQQQLLLMKPIILSGASGEGTNTTVENAEDVIDAMEKSTNVTVTEVAPSEGSTTASIELPKKEASAAEATHSLTIGSIDESTETIKIVEDENDTDNSISDLIINVPTTEDAKKLVIDMPNTTVTIAVNGESVTFEEVEATTAENTLFVKGGVTIKDLIIKAGNVSVQSGGKVEKITISEENKANATYVTYYVGAEARKEAYVADLDGLNTALADKTVTGIIFLNNIETSEKTCILSSVVINGNNKKLTYTGKDRAIEVATDGVDLTINDLDIEFTSGYCNRGIQYATSGNLELNNVRVESDVVTYVLNFPIKSSKAKVTITNSTLKGLIALNIWGENMTVNVINSHLTSVDNTSAENYAAVSLSFDGTNGANGTIVNIEGGSITAKDENGQPSTAVRNSTSTGKVTISSTTVIGEEKDPVALVLYEGASEFYSCYTLNDAIETALEDATGKASVKLIKDINLDADANISVPSGKTLVIDLNGKTISQEKEQTTGYQMILNDGNLTIKDSVGDGKISYTDTGTGGEYVSNTITNRGTLTIIDGIIENNSSETVANNGYPYAIDSSIWGEANEVVTNITGGVIRSTYSPLRVRADSQTENVIANISGGEIYGRIDHQMSNSKPGVIGILNISGGTFYQYGTKSSSIQVFGAGSETDASGIVLNISNGIFNAPIVIYRGEYVPLGKNFNEKFITGGTFSTDPSKYLAEGYQAVQSEDKWIVNKIQ